MSDTNMEQPGTAAEEVAPDPRITQEEAVALKDKLLNGIGVLESIANDLSSREIDAISTEKWLTACTSWNEAIRSTLDLLQKTVKVSHKKAKQSEQHYKTLKAAVEKEDSQEKAIQAVVKQLKDLRVPDDTSIASALLKSEALSTLKTKVETISSADDTANAVVAHKDFKAMKDKFAGLDVPTAKSNADAVAAHTDFTAMKDKIAGLDVPTAESNADAVAGHTTFTAMKDKIAGLDVPTAESNADAVAGHTTFTAMKDKIAGLDVPTAESNADAVAAHTDFKAVKSKIDGLNVPTAQSNADTVAAHADFKAIKSKVDGFSFPTASDNASAVATHTDFTAMKGKIDGLSIPTASDNASAVASHTAFTAVKSKIDGLNIPTASENAAALQDQFRGLAKEGELRSAIEAAASKTTEHMTNATKDFASKGDITEAVKSFATAQNVEDATKDLAKPSDVTSAIADLATKSDVTEAVKGFATSESIQNATKDLAKPSDVTSATANLATKSNVEDAVRGLAKADDVSTASASISTTITNAMQKLATQDDVKNAGKGLLTASSATDAANTIQQNINSSTRNLAGQVQGIANTVNGLPDAQAIITAMQTAGFATTTSVSNAINNTLATTVTSAVNAAFSQHVSNLATHQDIVSINSRIDALEPQNAMLLTLPQNMSTMQMPDFIHASLSLCLVWGAKDLVEAMRSIVRVGHRRRNLQFESTDQVERGILAVALAMWPLCQDLGLPPIASDLTEKFHGSEWQRVVDKSVAKLSWPQSEKKDLTDLLRDRSRMTKNHLEVLLQLARSHIKAKTSSKVPQVHALYAIRHATYGGIHVLGDVDKKAFTVAFFVPDVIQVLSSDTTSPSDWGCEWEPIAHPHAVSTLHDPETVQAAKRVKQRIDGLAGLDRPSTSMSGLRRTNASTPNADLNMTQDEIEQDIIRRLAQSTRTGARPGDDAGPVPQSGHGDAGDEATAGQDLGGGEETVPQNLHKRQSRLDVLGEAVKKGVSMENIREKAQGIKHNLSALTNRPKKPPTQASSNPYSVVRNDPVPAAQQTKRDVQGVPKIVPAHASKPPQTDPTQTAQPVIASKDPAPAAQSTKRDVRGVPKIAPAHASKPLQTNPAQAAQPVSVGRGAQGPAKPSEPAQQSTGHDAQRKDNTARSKTQTSATAYQVTPYSDPGLYNSLQEKYGRGTIYYVGPVGTDVSSLPIPSEIDREVLRIDDRRKWLTTTFNLQGPSYCIASFIERELYNAGRRNKSWDNTDLPCMECRVRGDRQCWIFIAGDILIFKGNIRHNDPSFRSRTLSIAPEVEEAEDEDEEAEEGDIQNISGSGNLLGQATGVHTSHLADVGTGTTTANPDIDDLGVIEENEEGGDDDEQVPAYYGAGRLVYVGPPTTVKNNVSNKDQFTEESLDALAHMKKQGATGRRTDPALRRECLSSNHNNQKLGICMVSRRKWDPVTNPDPYGGATSGPCLACQRRGTQCFQMIDEETVWMRE